MARRTTPTTTGVVKPRRPSRRIPESLWEPHDPEIKQLYVTDMPPKTLDQLRDHFRTTYGFNPSEKQWKDRLTKLKLKRNLDRPTAAVILHLLIEAEVKRIDRQVLFNGHRKVREDIDRYIAKNEKLSTTTELLESLPKSEALWPTSIVWRDNDVAEVPVAPPTLNCQPPQFWPPPAISNAADADKGFADPDYYNTLLADASSYSDFRSFNETVSTEHQSLAFGFPDDIMVRRNHQARAADNKNATTASRTAGSPEADQMYTSLAAHNEASTSQVQDDIVGPSHLAEIFEHARPGFNDIWNPMSAPSVVPYITPNSLTALHGLVSVTPFDFKLPAGARLADILDNVLGPYTGAAPSKVFIRHVLESCIYLGQLEYVASNHAMDLAVQAFQALMDQADDSYQWSLPVLNRLSFLLEAYGQKDMKRSVLTRLRQSLRMSIEPKWVVLQSLLDFLLDTAAWSADKAVANLALLRRAHETASQAASPTSPLTLAVSYNLAWCLLEAKQYQEALDAFLLGKAKCESAFGIYSLEAITWTATQARAHFRLGEQNSAIALMEEVVLSRAEKAYSTHHPIYWEVRYRVGLFLLQLEKTNDQQQSEISEAWERGESLLRNTLLWRGAYLGDNNPQTLAANKWLQHFLKEHGKPDEADDLWQWYYNTKMATYGQL